MTKQKTFADKTGLGCQNRSVTLQELDFEGQVLIWALRMSMRGAKQQEQVKDQFKRALLPSAARLASQSIFNIIEVVKGYGKRSLRLNCLCQSAISEDEKILLDFFKAVNNRDVQMVTHSANTFLNYDGYEKMIGALATFGISITNRKKLHGADRIPTKTFYHISEAIH